MINQVSHIESNHFCTECKVDIGSDDHVSGKHRGCGGKVVWNTYEVLVFKRLIMVDRIAVVSDAETS